VARRKVAIVTVAIALVGLGLVWAGGGRADVDPFPKTLVSVNAAGTDAGNSPNTVGSKPSLSVSADGTKIAFVSVSTDLTSGDDTNGLPDVFVRDMTTGVTQLVSVNAAGTDSGSGEGVANQGSSSPQLSADGTAVVFLSDARDLVTTPLGNFNAINLYVRDLVHNTTHLVNIDEEGTGGSDSASPYHPSISSDGSRVAFQSDSDDLVSLPTPGSPQVFVRDFDTAATTLVSVNTAGTSSTVNSATLPDMDASGTKVAFASGGGDLQAGVPGSGNQVWVRDLTAGTTTLISHSTAGATTPGNGGVDDLALSANGQAVTWVSNATDLTPTVDTNSANDVFVSRSGTTTHLSSGALGAGNNASHDPVISDDGTAVAFESDASDLVVGVSDINGSTDVFVRYFFDSTPRLVSGVPDGTATGSGASGHPTINQDGTRVPFVSNAPDLVDPANPDQGSEDAFVRESFVSKTSLISDGSKPDGIGDSEVFASLAAPDDVVVPISSDGSTVAFAANVVENEFGATDTNAANDVYAVDLHNQLVISPVSPVNEGDDHVTIEVTRSGLNGSDDTVDFKTADGSATQPADYEESTGTIHFAPGEVTKTVAIPITDDGDVDPGESFSFILEDPTGAARLPANPAVDITIVDNESPPPTSSTTTSSTTTSSTTTSSTTTTTPAQPPAECEPALTGGPGPDVIRGTPGPDHICGLGGNDTLIGGGGDDIMEGGIGSDVLRGYDGEDVLRGGNGNDELRGGAGHDSLFGGAGVDECHEVADAKTSCES
jgi:Tol biopolymer transport system component